MVDVRCGGCLVWWMSYFAYGVLDVWVVDAVRSLLYLISIFLLPFRAFMGVGLSVLHQSIFEATLANQLEPQELSDGKVQGKIPSENSPVLT